MFARDPRDEGPLWKSTPSISTECACGFKISGFPAAEVATIAELIENHTCRDDDSLQKLHNDISLLTSNQRVHGDLNLRFAGRIKALEDRAAEIISALADIDDGSRLQSDVASFFKRVDALGSREEGRTVYMEKLRERLTALEHGRASHEQAHHSILNELAKSIDGLNSRIVDLAMRVDDLEPPSDSSVEERDLGAYLDGEGPL